MKTVLPSLLLAMMFASTRASSEPAPWYKWRSKLDGTLACSQTALGPGWDRVGGAYRDSRCEKPAMVK
jgi:hypothetical protein